MAYFFSSYTYSMARWQFIIFYFAPKRSFQKRANERMEKNCVTSKVPSVTTILYSWWNRWCWNVPQHNDRLTNKMTKDLCVLVHTQKPCRMNINLNPYIFSKCSHHRYSNCCTHTYTHTLNANLFRGRFFLTRTFINYPLCHSCVFIFVHFALQYSASKWEKLRELQVF